MSSKSFKVVLLDTVHPVLPKMLAEAGIAYDELYKMPYEAVLDIIHEYDGIVLRSRIPIDAKMLEKGRRLKFVARVGAGMENIDTEAAEKLGISCLNSPEGNRDAVGEHTAGMLLALANKLLKADNEVRNGIWLREENRGFEIGKKTIGIIGYGNMGSAFAKRLSGFDAKILAFDKYKTGFGNVNVKEASLHDLFEECDILSLHVPLTDETHYMVDEKFLNSFRKNIVLINTARGKVVNTHALVNAMKAGKVTAAALDVLEYETSSFEKLVVNEDFNYLKAQNNVLLTPHIAGWSHESNIKLSSFLAEKIINLLN